MRKRKAQLGLLIANPSMDTTKVLFVGAAYAGDLTKPMGGANHGSPGKQQIFERSDIASS